MPCTTQVWVLDTLPGEVRSGGDDGSDHPGALIELLRSMRMPVANRNDVIDKVVHAGECSPRCSSSRLSHWPRWHRSQPYARP